MAQESTTINTQNSGGLFGGLFTGLGNLLKTAAPIAADVYTLKLQGDTLKTQYASDALAAQRLAADTAAKQAAAGSSMLPSWLKPWMIWTAAGVGAVAILVAVLRRR